MRKLIPIVSLLVIIIAILVVFSPCLRNGFVNWDDDVYITDNPVIISLSFWSVKKIFTSFLNTAYQPLPLLSFIFEYQFFKLNPFGYHLVNLLLHILNCVLVFWFIYLIAQDFKVTFITSMIFAIHPLRVESAAWISEFKGLLAAFLFLGCFISYLYYIKSGWRLRYYWLAFIFCLFSLMSKAIAVIVLPVLFLLDYVTARPYNRKALVDKIPFLSISVIFGFIAIIANNAGAPQNLAAPSGKILIACYALTFYIQKFFLPLGLLALYPMPSRANLFASVIPVAFIFLYVFILVRQGRKKYLFGILFFLIMIFPTLQLVNVGKSIVADRYAYLPYLGFCFLMGIIGAGLFKTRHIWIRAIFVLVFALAVANLGRMTFKRTLIWEDGISLWSDVLASYPDALAYTNRGNEYQRQGNLNQALIDFNEALEIDRNYALAYLNRGVLCQRQGLDEKAISDFNTAHKLMPKSALVLTDRAKTYEHLNKFKEAMEDYNLAILSNPDYPLAYFNRGVLWYRQNDFVRAFRDYSKTIQINPHNADAYYNRGLVNIKWLAFDKALDDFTHAIKYDAAKPDAFYERGSIYYSRRDFAKAILDYTSVVKIDQNYRNVYRNRAFAYFYAGDYIKSRLDARRAKYLKEDIPDEFLDELKNKVILLDKLGRT